MFTRGLPSGKFWTSTLKMFNDVSWKHSSSNPVIMAGSNCLSTGKLTVQYGKIHHVSFHSYVTNCQRVTYWATGDDPVVK